MQMENDFLRAISRTVHSLIAENHVGIVIQMTTTGKSLIDGEIIQLSNLSYLRLCKSIFMARLDSGFNHIRVYASTAIASFVAVEDLIARCFGR